MKRILVGFLSVLFVGLFIFFQKTNEEIKISKTRFQQKISSPPPEWMVRQIQQDLKPYSQTGISSKLLEEACTPDLMEKFSLIRFKIHNGHLSCSQGTSIDSPQFKKVYQALKTLCHLTPMPDVDFVLSLKDFLEECHIPQTPCFVFAKKEGTPNRILIPDFKALGGYKKLRALIEKANKAFPWSQKKEEVFWRGSTTGGFFTAATWNIFPRSKLVLLSLDYPKIINARFHHVAQCDPEMPQFMKESSMVSKSVKKEDHLLYKYLVDVDGNSCTYERCFWILLSNSLLIKQESKNIQWYYGALKPWKHYLPIQEDLSDLIEKIAWAKEHDARAKSMADTGSAFVRENLSPEDILLYVYHLLVLYSRLNLLSN